MCLQLVHQRGVAGIIGRIVSSASEYYSRLLPKRGKKKRKNKEGGGREARVGGITRRKAGSEKPAEEISE